MAIASVSRGDLHLQVCRGLARAFLAGRWTRHDLWDRGMEALGEEPPWLQALVDRVRRRWKRRPPPEREDELVAVIAKSRRVRDDRDLRVVRWFTVEPRMIRIKGAPARFAVFPLAGPVELGAHLHLSPSELAWFSDELGINTRTEREPLLHYRHRWVPKARGGHRLLEAPKERLKMIQRWILRHVLAPIPVSPAAHGFVPGRSVRSFVEPHADKAVVVRLDLEDFFASIGRGRIIALFRRLGYPPAVAFTLAALCTVATPLHVLRAHPPDPDPNRRFLTNLRLRAPHLPQGSPTSPALSNLAAWRLDRRLQALAGAFGATMTRYADDLAFAGDAGFHRRLGFFLPQVGAVALEEGFRINHRKTRVMSRGQRQQLCGLVINRHPAVPRAELDDLKALLFNAARFGPDGQNRASHPRFREHLLGRIAWVASLHPGRGARLRALFDRITWPAQ